MVPEIQGATNRISVILGHFLPFDSPNNPNNQNFEKMKSEPADIIFYTNAPKIMIICYAVPEIWRATDLIFIFQFEYFLPFTPLTAQRIKIFKKCKKKKKKNAWRYHRFTHAYQKLASDDVWVLRYGARQTDG